MSKFQMLQESIKEEVLLLLSSYIPQVINTDKELEPALLYEANKLLNDKLTFLKLKLELPFEEDEAAIKKYGFNKIVKFVNPGNAAKQYHIHIEKKWKQVNDPIKVELRLEEELAVWANSYKLHSFQELDKASGATEVFIKEQKALVEARIKEAKLECKKIKDNFSNYSDVRICSKHRAHDYGTIHFTLDNGKKFKNHLSIKMPNVIYYEKPAFRSNNKLDEFLSEAVNVFGDVWVVK